MTFLSRKWVKLMSKFWTVLWHTYLSKLKSKQFIITTIIVAVLLIGVSNINQIIDVFNNQDKDKIAVIDHTGHVYEPLAKRVQQTSDEIKLISYDQSEQKVQTALEEGKFKGYLVISLNDKKLPTATYKSKKVAESSIINTLQQSLQQVKVAMATQQLGLDAAQLAKVYSPVSFETVALSDQAKSEKELNQARVVVYIIVLLMFVSVLMYGMMIAMEVVTEKSSRVMEILVSSVSPVKQLFGKIFGVAFLGLTQAVFLFLVGFFSFKLFAGAGDTAINVFKFINLDMFDPTLIAFAIVFFILGFLLYATLLAMLGSLVNRVEEANQMMMPMTLLLVIAFYIAMFGMSAPDNPFIMYTSFVPFFSPMIMILRIGMLSVPIWQIALSLGLLVVFIIIFVIVGARIYRGGVLMYGNATSWKSIKHAFVLTKKEK